MRVFWFGMGVVPWHMRTSGQTLSRYRSYRFWKKVLVDELNFPFVKVPHGFLDLVPEKKLVFFVCNSYKIWQLDHNFEVC